MQRTKLREILNKIIDDLKTVEIVDTLDTDLAKVSSTDFMALLLESKTGYDHLSELEKDLLVETGIYDFYETANFVKIVSHVNRIVEGIYGFLDNNLTSRFLASHRALSVLLTIVDEYLIPQKDILDDNNEINEQLAEDKNILILQLVKEENMTLDELSLRINLIKDLIDSIIEIIIRIYPSINIKKPEILLLDSGSDAQVWIEIIASQLDKVNVVKYIANAFITVWNHYMNKDLHRAKKMSEIDKLEMQQLRDRLNIVKEMNDSGMFEKKEIEKLGNKVVEKVGISIENGTVTNELVNQPVVEAKTNRQLIITSNKLKELSVKSEKKQLPPHLEKNEEEE
ncbi:hypothetical protein V9L05_21195 [Bernardetia sp. Wsw4-3y2]|uniref:hypothetical protein n=1 Tax=Bernardetia sp. Wsw4-3y2 TaxID=3127471 RepID=UPI0030D12543